MTVWSGGWIAGALALVCLGLGCSGEEDDGLVSARGNVDAVVEMAGMRDGQFQMVSMNYLTAGDVTYYLWFRRDTKVVGMRRQVDGDALQIPVPREIGPVIIFKGAEYLAKGREFGLDSEELPLERGDEPMVAPFEMARAEKRRATIPKERDGRPVRILHVDYFELTKPAPGRDAAK